jgi:hypothetical protein
MNILCIAGTPVDITIIHCPQIGDDIYVMLHHIPRQIRIDHARVQK